MESFCASSASAAGASNPYTAGEWTDIYSGDVQVCVNSSIYDSDSVIADIAGASYNSQIVFDIDGSANCKAVEGVPANSKIRFVVPMGYKNLNISRTDRSAGGNVNLEITNSRINKYLNSYGSTEQVIAASKVEISFDANGGTGTMSVLSDVSLNTNVTLSANTFTKADYAFAGWNTKADGSGTAYVDGATVTFPKGGEVTLYAQWVVATATLQTGQKVNAALKTLAAGSAVSYSTSDTLIKNLSFVDTLPSTVDANTPKVNIALDGEMPVYAYWVASDEAIYINTEANKIYANNNSNSMFSNMQALTSLTLPESFDTSKVTNMSQMFSNMQALTSLTLPESFNTSNVTNMSSMFSDMQALTSLTLPESFNTSKVTYMDYMFSGMQALTSLTLPESFNTSKVTYMSSMFSEMRALTSLTLPESFNTSKVTYMSSMFSEMRALTSLTLPESFNTSNVTNMSYMFSGMQALTSLTISFNTSKVTDIACSHASSHLAHAARKL